MPDNSRAVIAVTSSALHYFCRASSELVSIMIDGVLLELVIHGQAIEQDLGCALSSLLGGV